jgi:cobalt-zinc-cadmium efflux system membrane fusion protein
MNKNTTRYIAVIYLSALVAFTGCAGKKKIKKLKKVIASVKNLRKISNW